MRWKIEGDDQNAYKCCFCCHVRTGTIFLGLFHLVAHILVLSMFSVMLLHPELVQEGQIFPSDGEVIESPTFDNNYSYGQYQWFRERQWTSDDKFVFLLINMGSFFVTVLLIWGAIKGNAGYLMPFFCIQVFDFCVSCLTIVGYFSYMPDIKKWIEMQPLPYKEELLTLDADFLMLLVVAMFVGALTIKAYFIGVIWACYRYFTCNMAIQGTATILRAYEASNGEDSEMLLPPKYEDAIRMSLEESIEQPPPPAYYPN